VGRATVEAKHIGAESTHSLGWLAFFDPQADAELVLHDDADREFDYMTGSEWPLEQAKAQGGRWPVSSTNGRPSSPAQQRPQIADGPADSDLEGEGVATVEPEDFDPH
jgi:hypothetical protein